MALSCHPISHLTKFQSRFQLIMLSRCFTFNSVMSCHVIGQTHKWSSGKKRKRNNSRLPYVWCTRGSEYRTSIFNIWWLSVLSDSSISDKQSSTRSYLLSVGKLVDHGPNSDSSGTGCEGEGSSDIIESRGAHDRDGDGTRDSKCCCGRARVQWNVS